MFSARIWIREWRNHFFLIFGPSARLPLCKSSFIRVIVISWKRPLQLSFQPNFKFQFQISFHPITQKCLILAQNMLKCWEIIIYCSKSVQKQKAFIGTMFFFNTFKSKRRSRGQYSKFLTQITPSKSESWGNLPCINSMHDFWGWVNLEINNFRKIANCIQLIV